MIDSDFRWSTGIECSFIPHLGIDQYKWTQHDRFWRQDFALIGQDLGCRWLRYALPWHEIERQPGQYDWGWFDQRLALFEELGINLMLDLAHFGTPTWLPDAFADPDFPAALERLARAFGERYAGRVPCVCPINEPLITSLFCGDIGLWPPYGHGLNRYITTLSRVGQGFCRAVKVLRETMPGVEILVCDSLEVAVTYEDSGPETSPFLRETLRDDVTRRMHRRHIGTDLVQGRIDHTHPLLPWMQKAGFSDYDCHWFLKHRASIDIIGLDYYEHTEVELYTTPEGYYRQRSLKPPLGLYQAAQDYWTKYHIPLMVTETSAGGGDGDKVAWLEKSVHDVRRLRAEGFPVIGYTWWPVIDHLDWDGALLHQTGHIHPVGIYRLERGPGGKLERRPTGLRDAYKALIDGGSAAAGPLVETEDQRAQRQSREAFRQSSGPVKLGWPIIAFGPAPKHYQLPGRNEHLFREISRRHRVLYVEEPIWSESEEHGRAGLHFYPLHPNLYNLSIHLPAALEHDKKAAWNECRRLLAEALAEPPLAGNGDGAVGGHGGAADAALISEDMLPGARATVYDAADHVPDEALRARADLVFTASEGAHALAPGSVYLPPGVETRHFARAQSRRVAVPNDMNFVPRPVLGYFGAVDERLDYELIAALADADPNWSLVMVGPVERINPESLPRRANIFWLGRRPYGEMPDYAHGFQVGIAPFAVNEATRLHRPAKLGEYLLAGRPAVCTDLPEARSEDFAGGVVLAGTREEFIEACRRAVRGADHEATQRVRRAWAKRSWKRVARTMEAGVEAILAKK